MDFLKFALTAILSSALVSAALFAIITLLTPRRQPSVQLRLTFDQRQPLDQPLQSPQGPLLSKHHGHVENRG